MFVCQQTWNLVVGERFPIEFKNVALLPHQQIGIGGLRIMDWFKNILGDKFEAALNAGWQDWADSGKKIQNLAVGGRIPSKFEEMTTSEVDLGLVPEESSSVVQACVDEPKTLLSGKGFMRSPRRWVHRSSTNRLTFEGPGVYVAATNSRFVGAGAVDRLIIR
jgi:hypothetical protein